MDGFIKLDLNVSSHSFVNYDSSYVIGSNNIDSTTWHARLGHIGRERMTREGLLGSLTKVDLQLCEPCLAGKACKKPFGKTKRAAQPIELVHSDICGPMNKKACHRASYFLTLIDDYSRHAYVYLLSHCHEALDCFKRFVAKVENKHVKGLKTFRTDRRRDLFNQFKEFYEEKGILRHLTIPHTLQQNGVAERRNITLLDMTRSMMAQANLPISFWEDACDTPNPGVPLTTRQPAKFQWISGDPIPHYCVPFIGIHILKKNRVESPLFEELYPTYNLYNNIIITHPGSQQKYY